MKKTGLIRAAIIAASLCVTTGASHAASVGGAPAIDVMPLDKFTLDLRGFDNFPSVVAGDLVVSWDPTVLTLTNVDFSNPPWDTTASTNADDGASVSLFFGRGSGDASGEFDIANLAFDVVGDIGSTTTIDVEPFTGFYSEADPLNAVDAVYIDTEVKVVPLPAAAWLLLSGIFTLGVARRRSRRT